jgi:hypothetical protein
MQGISEWNWNPLGSLFQSSIVTTTAIDIESLLKQQNNVTLNILPNFDLGPSVIVIGFVIIALVIIILVFCWCVAAQITNFGTYFIIIALMGLFIATTNAMMTVGFAVLFLLKDRHEHHNRQREREENGMRMYSPRGRINKIPTQMSEAPQENTPMSATIPQNTTVPVHTFQTTNTSAASVPVKTNAAAPSSVAGSASGRISADTSAVDTPTKSRPHKPKNEHDAAFWKTQCDKCGIEKRNMKDNLVRLREYVGKKGVTHASEMDKEELAHCLEKLHKPSGWGGSYESN